LRNVSFLPYQPRALLAHSLSAAAVHYVSLRPGFEGAVVPCKIFGIMAAARPVVAAVSEKSELGQLVRAAGCGAVVAPGDPLRLAEAISALRQKAKELEEIGARGRSYLKGRFEKKVMVARYEDLFLAVSAAKSVNP
jgi:colanic acid biosynthesis glycosyl transferase WcaI